MLLLVKVKAGAKKDSVEGGNPVIVSVKERAEKGRANLAVIRLLSRHLSVPSSSIRIIKGHASSKKLVEIF